jgi:2-methylcitrate dehydratase PrpD
MAEQSLGMTRRLARFVVGTDEADIPAPIYEHTKVALMDWLGVTLAGKDEPLVKKLLHYTDIMGGKEQSTILGHGLQKTVSQAAMINGAASHALDFDDTLAAFSGHPSVTLFPGLLALSEWLKKNGRDFLTAYIIGLKVGMAVGISAGPKHYASGFHSTSTVGTLASAAACSRLMDLDEQQTIHALGIAGTQSFGLKRSFGTMCKPFHAGRASEVGVTAALLAGDGFTGAEDILEGPNGFFQAMRGSVNEQFMGTLGQTWGIENLAQKYHASCHFTHSPIEAALSISRKQGLPGEDIESVEVFCSETALTTADIIEARTGLEGKFSIPYCVANALLRGNTGLSAFTDELVAEPEVKTLMQKITVRQDPEAQGMEARVTIKTRDGNEYSADSDVFKEIPELVLKKVKIKDKFTDLCSPMLDSARIKKIVGVIFGLESVKDMSALVKLAAI